MTDEERVLKNIKYIIKQNYVDTEDDIIGILISASNLIKKQSKEIEELNIKILSNAGIYQLGFNDGEKKVKDKIKAKIEEYEKLINKCPMNDEEIFCKECTEKCGFNQTINVLQSLLEKE